MIPKSMKIVIVPIKNIFNDRVTKSKKRNMSVSLGHIEEIIASSDDALSNGIRSFP